MLREQDPAYIASVQQQAGWQLTLGCFKTLGRLIPDDWQLSWDDVEGHQPDNVTDTVIHVTSPPGAHMAVVVEVKAHFSLKDARTVLGGHLKAFRQTNPYLGVCVFAGFLSPQTRAVLEEQDVSYVDVAGNVFFKLTNPAIFVRQVGPATNPNPVRRSGELSLRGAQAGRVVRVLADVRPPYTATALAEAATVSLPTVSRLLTAMDREALVERAKNGLVVDVDWAALLRRRAETYALLTANRPNSWITGRGAEAALGLFLDGTLPYVALTGSFVASRLAPVAAPGQLTVYVQPGFRPPSELGWLPTEQGADVITLEALDTERTVRSMQDDRGAKVVAYSQLVLDCLGGPGRMPAEGEALIELMRTTEDQWRVPDITVLAARGTGSA